MSSRFIFNCECNDDACTEKLPLTHDQWKILDAERAELNDKLTKGREAFIVIPGHCASEQDRVLATTTGCAIVSGKR